MSNLDEQQLKRLEEVVANVWLSRNSFFSQFWHRSDQIYREANYPEYMNALFYRQLYDRMPIARRVVELEPKESWRVQPLLYENEKSKVTTPFEKRWDELGKFLHTGGKSWHKEEEGSIVWDYLMRADIQSGIGVFGAMLLGIDDGRLLEQPADGVPADGTPKDITGVAQDIYGGQLPPQLQRPLQSTLGTDAQYFTTIFSPMQPPAKSSKHRNLTFLRVFDESLVQVVQYEASMFSPRFGQPIMYLITLNDPRQPHTGVGLPLATVRVHWSRVVHLADNLINSEIFGSPRMQSVVNNIIDLQKIYAASGEGYWQSAFTALSLETNPQLGADVVVDKEGVRSMMDEFRARLRRDLVLTGMTAKTLAPNVVDPKPHIDAQIEAICIKKGCPVRIFKGADKGGSAGGSTDASDDDNWRGRMIQRQKIYLSSRLVSPFVDRLILLGILPEPDGYFLEWPGMDTVSRKDKAAIAVSQTQALAAYGAGNVEALMRPLDYLVYVFGMDEDEAEAILAQAKDNDDRYTPDPSEAGADGGEPGHMLSGAPHLPFGGSKEPGVPRTGVAGGMGVGGVKEGRVY
jgi:hypothetical protein